MDATPESRSGEGRRREDRRKAVDPDFRGTERRSGVDRRLTADRRRSA